jgi:hypothetical protein
VHVLLLLAALYLACNLAFGLWKRRRRRAVRTWRNPVLLVGVVFALCAFGSIGAERLPFTITIVPPDPTLGWLPTKTLSGFLTVGAIASGLVLLYLTLRELLRVGFGVASWLQRRLS